MHNTELNTVLTAYREISRTHIGRSDAISIRKNAIITLKPAIMADIERGVSISKICATVRQVLPEIGSTQFVRSVISPWKGRRHKKITQEVTQ